MGIYIDFNNFDVVAICGLLFLTYVSMVWGDSSKSTGWMFFLAPIGWFIYLITGVFRLTMYTFNCEWYSALLFLGAVYAAIYLISRRIVHGRN